MAPAPADENPTSATMGRAITGSQRDQSRDACERAHYAEAATEVEKWTIRTRRRQSTAVIGINCAQSRLIQPNTTMLNLARIMNDALDCALRGHYTALSLRNANSTMRNSINPSRKREICVSP